MLVIDLGRMGRHFAEIFSPKSSRHLLEDTEARFRFMRDHRSEFSMERMAEGAGSFEERFLCLAFAPRE